VLEAVGARREAVRLHVAGGAAWPRRSSRRTASWGSFTSRTRARRVSSTAISTSSSPWRLLAASLEQARDRQRLADVAEALLPADPLRELIGDSEPMRRLRERLKRWPPPRPPC
jgi:hypothetical protein